MNLSQRYHWSKGVRDRQHEDGVSGNLAVTCHLEESASHHLGHSLLQREGGAKHSPPGDDMVANIRFHQENHVFKNPENRQ